MALSRRSVRWAAGTMAAALVALALGGTIALAQDNGCVGLEITPARLAEDGQTSLDYPVTFRNCDDVAYDVVLSVQKLGHDLDGTPQFYESAEHEDALRLAGDASFTIDPGDTEQLDASAVIPEGKRSLYAGVVAEFKPSGGQGTRTVDVRTRVAGMLLMRAPKPWQQSASVVDVGLEKLEDGTYAVHAAVKDTGNVHINPTGTMEIRKDGRLLDTVPLQGETILPGFKRRLLGAWDGPKKLNGKVNLTAVIQNPSGRRSETFEFTEGVVSDPAGRITSLIASEVDGALIEVSFRNTGRVDLTPTIELTATEGEFERARELRPFAEALPPGASRVITWRPDLADGTYEIKARAIQGDALLDERVTGLRLGAAVAPPPEASRWPALIIAAMLLITVVGALMFVLAKRRRRNDDGGGTLAPVRELPQQQDEEPLTRTAAR